MRTKKEIDAEIKKLKEMKPRVRHFNAFGDDHHAAIYAQLEVLKGEVDEDEFEDKVDSDDWTESDRENAQRAFDWMEEYSDGPSPSEEWSELIVE